MYFPRGKQWIRLAKGGIAAYVLICAAVYFLQGFLLFPGAAYQGSADTRVSPPAGCELVRLKTGEGDQIAAMYAPAVRADPGDSPLTAVYFYGNGDSIAWSAAAADFFRRQGMNVLVPDYAGYGMSSGKPSEKSLYATADAAYDELIRRGVRPGQIIAVGYSLGSAVAVDLAWRRSVGGLIVFNAFTSLPDEAAKVYPWLPTRLIVSWRFDSHAKIAAIKCPVLICNGLRDDLVPARMSDSLAAAAGGPVTRCIIPDAEHNGILSEHSEAVAESLKKFLAMVK